MGIEKGDLVEVIETCPCCAEYLHMVTTVAFVAPDKIYEDCGLRNYVGVAALPLPVGGIMMCVGMPLPWLRKIQPPKQEKREPAPPAGITITERIYGDTITSNDGWTA